MIELLVVIAIIGILSSVVLASLTTARSKSRDARRLSDLKQFQIALELYYDTNREYPINLADLVTGGQMASIPDEPHGVAYQYDALTSSVTSCDTVPANCVSYVIGSDFEGPLPTGDTSDGTLGSASCADPDPPSGVYCVRP